MDIPMPPIKPAVPNKPARFVVQKLLPIKLHPMKSTPIIDVALEPTNDIRRMTRRPKAAPPANPRDPTKERVDGGVELSVESRSAACSTPQQLMIPLFQKVISERQNTIVYPSNPPSGTAVVV